MRWSATACRQRPCSFRVGAPSRRRRLGVALPLGFGSLPASVQGSKTLRSREGARHAAGHATAAGWRSGGQRRRGRRGVTFDTKGAAPTQADRRSAAIPTASRIGTAKRTGPTAIAFVTAAGCCSSRTVRRCEPAEVFCGTDEAVDDDAELTELLSSRPVSAKVSQPVSLAGNVVAVVPPEVCFVPGLRRRLGGRGRVQDRGDRAGRSACAARSARGRTPRGVVRCRRPASARGRWCTAGSWRSRLVPSASSVDGIVAAYVSSVSG